MWLKIIESGWIWLKVDGSGWKYLRCYKHLWCRYFDLSSLPSNGRAMCRSVQKWVGGLEWCIWGTLLLLLLPSGTQVLDRSWSVKLTSIITNEYISYWPWFIWGTQAFLLPSGIGEKGVFIMGLLTQRIWSTNLQNKDHGASRDPGPQSIVIGGRREWGVNDALTLYKIYSSPVSILSRKPVLSWLWWLIGWMYLSNFVKFPVSIKEQWKALPDIF